MINKQVPWSLILDRLTPSQRTERRLRCESAHLPMIDRRREADSREAMLRVAKMKRKANP